MAASSNNCDLSFTSRRSFLGLSAAASAGLAFRIITEPMMAHARIRDYPNAMSKDAIHIDANENPLGPAASARAAASAILPQGGRSSDWFTDRLWDTRGENGCAR